jgi:hypothetical protein
MTIGSKEKLKTSSRQLAQRTTPVRFRPGDAPGATVIGKLRELVDGGGQIVNCRYTWAAKKVGGG